MAQNETMDAACAIAAISAWQALSLRERRLATSVVRCQARCRKKRARDSVADALFAAADALEALSSEGA